jgi:hypothetical protein
MENKLWVIFGALTMSLLGNRTVMAAESNGKYATIVNPVRSRDLWKEKSLTPLETQYKLVSDRELAATWLIQDDVNSDKELVDEIKTFNKKQEIGIFLEVSKKLTEKARVYYPTGTAWYNPKAVFLSGYTIGERKKIIDVMMDGFKRTWGYYPKSAGAWWVDSVSLNYLTEKYGVKTVMIVTDQRTTDNYGVWGQWWGYPYIPSKNNILVPGDSKAVVIQWALRDLERAYAGSGPKVSNFSLQANDYLSQGLNFEYFEKLANQYLEVERLGQITVGLEVGMESFGNESELGRQLEWIKKNSIETKTMAEFAEVYRRTYGNKNPTLVKLGNWKLTDKSRENEILKEKTIYNGDWSFEDTFLADRNDFLNRVLPTEPAKTKSGYYPWWILMIPFLTLFGVRLKLKPLIIVATILAPILIFLPMMRSGELNGWKVFYGPMSDNLIVTQILVMGAGTVGLMLMANKLKAEWEWVFASLGWWPIWLQARFTDIAGEKQAGWLLDNFRFIGVGIKNGIKLRLINEDMPSTIAAATIRFRPEKWWSNGWLYYGLYPVVIVGLSLISAAMIKRMPKAVRVAATLINITMVGIFIYLTMTADPVSVAAIK